jgi:PIN domain nuclease of toxin-antitoxin system
MRLLLDTHVWLWLQHGPTTLAAATLAELEDPQHELYLSAASAWEIAIKFAAGRLGLTAPPARYVPERMVLSGTKPLPILPVHALAVADLPNHHRDPFDRLLVAQALHESMTLVSRDRKLEPYGVPMLWA